MLKLFFVIFTSLFLLNSCVETIVVGTVTAGAVILSDGSIFDLSQDSRIKTSIKRSFKDDVERESYENINVNVYSGKVMLTGYVNNRTYKNKAVKKVKSIKPEIEVIDEIMVFSSNYKVNPISDSFISTQISLKLKTAKDVTSWNYEYDVVDGIVYIIGMAKNKDELKKATDVISRIKGVKKVISYILIATN